MAAAKPRILLVDDNSANLLAFEALLGGEYDLVSARSGEEAIEAVNARPDIDVVLMDVHMPGMDGFEATERIKRLENGRDLPVIFVTAVYSEDPFVRKGFQAGGIDYFSKPFDPKVLKLKLGIYASFRSRQNVLRERERQLRESEELRRVGRRLSSVLESLPLGVLIADVEGRVRQTTEEVSRIFKEPPASGSFGEILGWWDGDGRMLKDPKAPLARALAGETTHGESMQVRCFDGSPKRILASASPLRGLDGQIVGAVVLVQDFTETQEIEQALQERVARLIGAGVEIEETVAR